MSKNKWAKKSNMFYIIGISNESNKLIISGNITKISKSNSRIIYY